MEDAVYVRRVWVGYGWARACAGAQGEWMCKNSLNLCWPPTALDCPLFCSWASHLPSLPMEAHRAVLVLTLTATWQVLAKTTLQIDFLRTFIVSQQLRSTWEIIP